MSYRLEEIDRRSIYELMADGRHTSAPAGDATEFISLSGDANVIDVTVQPDDILTVFSRSANTERVLVAFVADEPIDSVTE